MIDQLRIAAVRLVVAAEMAQHQSSGGRRLVLRVIVALARVANAMVCELGR